MIFTQTGFDRLYLIDLEIQEDDRGLFARTWCNRELELNGISTRVAQSSITRNKVWGTLRGLHYQKEPYAEEKIITCLDGAIYDVVVDLRIDSRTYLNWISFHLTSVNKKMLFIPTGFAHGYQTLEDKTLVLYYSSEFYNPSAEMGIRFNDPFFSIEWPREIRSISTKDKNWADFKQKIA